MTLLIRLLKRIARPFAYALVVLLIVLVPGIALLGLTGAGARFAASTIASVASSPDRIISIAEPSGLLSGRLRVPHILISDSKGPFAQIDNLAVDWSPLALLRTTFEAELITAESVNVLRAPVTTVEPVEDEDTAFSLPVNLEIDRIDLPALTIGKQLAGQSFVLSASGKATADRDTIDLSVAIARKDDQQGRATADVVFAPADNRLTLKADISEPQGGLVSRLLNLPGEPALDLALNGQGPLSDWAGHLAASVAGTPVIALDGNHKSLVSGGHQIALTGGGKVDTLMPPAFRQLFTDETRIDLAATFDADGRITVEAGNVTTGALLLTASGTIDPAGDNSLNANLIGTAGPVDVRWPLATGELRALISGLDISLTGAAASAKLKLVTAIQSLQMPQGRIEGLKLSADSDAFDIANRSGPLAVQLSAEQTVFVNPDLDRAVRAPLMVSAPLAVTPDTIGFDGTTLESAGVGGTLNGNYDIAGRTLASAFRIFVLPDLLPDAVASKFEGTISAEGQLAATLPGRMAITGLKLTSSTVEATGSVSLTDDVVKAELDGRVPDIGRFAPDMRGKADFTLSAKGPVSAPAFTATLQAENAVLAGRKLTALSLKAQGTADSAAPQASIRATGSLDGQRIDIDADLVSRDGVTSLPKLTADIGKNRISGALTFSRTFDPDGRLSFDLPDLGLLAALAGQKASGDIKGTVDFSNTAGSTTATIAAIGSRVSAGGAEIAAPDISVLADIHALSAEGRIKAAEIVSGGNRIAAPILSFDHTGASTGFALTAGYDGTPLTLSGTVGAAKGTTVVTLQAFSAAPRKIPVKLAAPATVTVTNGEAVISNVTLTAGGGSVKVAGSAGKALDIGLAISALPASLANTFVPALAAEGAISGTVKVTGSPTAPAIGYDLAWANAVVSQTRAAGLGSLGIKASGRFENDIVTTTLGLTGAGGLSLSGGGSAAIAGNKALDLSFQGKLPFSTLSGQLAPQALSLEGQAGLDIRITGTTTSPSITGTVTTSGAKLIDVRRNISMNGLTASVSLERDVARITQLQAKLSTGGSISGSGTIGISPGSGFPADIILKLDKAAYVDGTLVSTSASGSLGLSGPLLSSPVLSGDITLGKTSITVPEKLPASLAAINVQHKNAPADVRQQSSDIRRAGGDGASSDIGLDLKITAPQIFVRGRGIDAELGGTLTMRGTASSPAISGGFDMRRGRLIILNKRLDFASGKITFGGALIPALNMVANTTSGSSTTTVTVSGLANDPAVAFSSSPSLPQDEILAQLIFGQSMSKLSALQIAQLADAASQLAGGRSTSLFQSLRSNLGVDDLDISTDDKGQAQVSAGKYLNDKTYLEVQQGSNATSKAIINLDVGKGVKLRGEAGSDGSGGAGIFFEREY